MNLLQQQNSLLKVASRAAFLDELGQIKEAIPISALLKNVKPEQVKNAPKVVGSAIPKVNKELGQFKSLISKPTASSINWGNA